jgi:citrate synthase
MERHFAPHSSRKADPVALQNIDKQIYRMIGKATTLAAMAYRDRQGREFVVPSTGMSYAELYVPYYAPSRYDTVMTGCIRFLFQLDHLSHK